MAEVDPALAQASLAVAEVDHPAIEAAADSAPEANNESSVPIEEKVAIDLAPEQTVNNDVGAEEEEEKRDNPELTQAVSMEAPTPIQQAEPKIDESAPVSVPPPIEKAEEQQ